MGCFESPGVQVVWRERERGRLWSCSVERDLESAAHSQKVSNSAHGCEEKLVRKHGGELGAPSDPDETMMTLATKRSSSARMGFCSPALAAWLAGRPAQAFAPG